MEPTGSRKPRAIDLYSGVGGWSLGLGLAGVEVVASYEKWGTANETNFKNNGHQAQTVDIRRLALTDLPSDIDMVVGSPPCTQFSYSNRGGSGDLSDGLEDIKCFLRIVDHLRPRVWAMENVPRVAKILAKELGPDGALAEFRHLDCVPHVIDMADFGLPQRRRRCIAGNFDMNLLNSYRRLVEPLSLGEVVGALAAGSIVDPIYGVQIPKQELVDHIEEDFLTEEEVRINRTNKVLHPVYNRMPFPEPLHRPVRTITATCTRVSRESVVIGSAERPSAFRRLTIRERATLQGFPVTFQFYGTNYGQKLRMIGNAVPPAFTYLLGHCLRGSSPEEVHSLRELGRNLRAPAPVPVQARPERAGSKFPQHRTFRFAIPTLHLKSGVRFELRNVFEGEEVSWRVDFYFGTPRAIRSIGLDGSLHGLLLEQMGEARRERLGSILCGLKETVAASDIRNMQKVWAHRGPGGTRPFMLLDELNDRASALLAVLDENSAESSAIVEEFIARLYGRGTLPVGHAKLNRNASVVLAGLMLGSVVNQVFGEDMTPECQRLTKVAEEG